MNILIACVTQTYSCMSVPDAQSQHSQEKHSHLHATLEAVLGAA